MPQRCMSKRNRRASSARSATWIASARNPQSTKTGALARPWKLLCEASTATSTASSALASGAEPGKRASGVCATTRPATVAMSTVEEVGVNISPSGSTATSRAEPRPTDERDAEPEQHVPGRGRAAHGGCVSSG